MSHSWIRKLNAISLCSLLTSPPKLALQYRHCLPILNCVCSIGNSKTVSSNTWFWLADCWSDQCLKLTINKRHTSQSVDIKPRCDTSFHSVVKLNQRRERLIYSQILFLLCYGMEMFMIWFMLPYCNRFRIAIRHLCLSLCWVSRWWHHLIIA